MLQNWAPDRTGIDLVISIGYLMLITSYFHIDNQLFQILTGDFLLSPSLEVMPLTWSLQIGQVWTCTGPDWTAACALWAGILQSYQHWKDKVIWTFLLSRDWISIAVHVDLVLLI